MGNTNLPDGWIVTTLGKISTNVMYGMNARAIDFDGKNKYIRITDIDDKSNMFCPAPLTSPDGVADAKYKLIQDDLLFARTGASVGKSYLYNKHDGDLYFAGFLIKFHIFEQNSRFVFLQAQTPSYWNWVKSVSMRSGQPGINAEEYKKLPIIIAPLDEQQKIADTIEIWDLTIEKTKTLIDAKERQFEWLLYELIGSRKADTSLSEICTAEKGKKLDRNEDGIRYLEIGDIDIETKDYQIDNKEKTPVSGAIKVPANTLLISTVRPTRGAITKTKSEIYVSSAFCRLKLENDFYFYCLQQKKFFNYLKDKQSGATYPTVKDRDILTFKVPTLPETEQKRIANTLNTARHEIVLLKKLMEAYQTQKRGLMQKLLSSKWRVKV